MPLFFALMFFFLLHCCLSLSHCCFSFCQDASKTRQDVSKTPPRRARTHQHASKTPPRHAQTRQDVAKTRHRRVQNVPRHSKIESLVRPFFCWVDFGTVLGCVFRVEFDANIHRLGFQKALQNQSKINDFLILQGRSSHEQCIPNRMCNTMRPEHTNLRPKRGKPPPRRAKTPPRRCHDALKTLP